MINLSSSKKGISGLDQLATNIVKNLSDLEAAFLNDVIDKGNIDVAISNDSAYIHDVDPESGYDVALITRGSSSFVESIQDGFFTFNINSPSNCSLIIEGLDQLQTSRQVNDFLNATLGKYFQGDYMSVIKTSINTVSNIGEKNIVRMIIPQDESGYDEGGVNLINTSVNPTTAVMVMSLTSNMTVTVSNFNSILMIGSGAINLIGANPTIVSGDLTDQSMTGSVGNESLYGLAGDDNLNGFSGNDKIDGGDGSDTLIGGLGQDSITGGLGKDIFKFISISDSSAGYSRDIITDFNKKEKDIIDLSGIDANNKSPGDSAFASIVNGSHYSGKFKVPGTLFFDKSTHVLYGNNDDDAGADFSVQLTGINTLSISDLIL